MPPAYQPSQIPPPDTVLTGQDEHDPAAELLTLTWEFFTRTSPTVREELHRFLTSRGCHPATALGWFLDALQSSAHILSQPPSGDPPRQHLTPRSTSGARIHPKTTPDNRPAGAKNRSKVGPELTREATPPQINAACGVIGRQGQNAQSRLLVTSCTPSRPMRQCRRDCG